MPKIAASEAAWVGRTASMVLALAVILVGCSGAGSETQEEAASAAPPRAKDDTTTTSEEREVLIEMVSNDSGRSLEIDKVQPGRAHGDIICDAEIETGKIRAGAYTPRTGAG